MSSANRRTFHLYAFPAKVNKLTIGSLVLGSFKEPFSSRHYIHRSLSEAEQEHYVSSYELADLVLSKKQGQKLNIFFEAFDLANLGGTWEGEGALHVAAKKGRRITLDDPQNFLDTEILSSKAAQEALQLWLSAAASNYVGTAFARLWKPKIWLLTGLYILEDARTLSVTSKQPSVSLGISSIAVAALSNIPLGGSIDIGTQYSVQVKMVVQGEGIWAAQFRRLDVKYFWPGQKGIELKTIPLYNTVAPDGDAYDSNVEAYLPPEVATISIQSKNSSQNREFGGTQWSESESEEGSADEE